VAIVGSGPSGFYAAEALFKADLHVQVAMFEKLPVPYGLVRFGVAPDHGKIRSVIKMYEKTAADDRFTFWGNVDVGADITVPELTRHFDAVIFAFGAATDRKLNIPGEDLPRSYTATSFCAWYNGHPEYQDCRFDLDQEIAVVIGQGNVAMDVARILALPTDQLDATDMASNAVDALAQSRVRDIHVIGRRGAAQAKFTPKEIGELGEIADCDLIIDPKDLELSDADKAELELPESKANARNYELLKRMAGQTPRQGRRHIFLHFYLSPRQIMGDDSVEGVLLEKNRMEGEPGNQWSQGTGETIELPCGVFFRSVGYKGVALPEIPFNDKKGVIPNEAGRVEDTEQQLYCTGWIKRGPSGLIGTNKADSVETVKTLIDDLPNFKPCDVPRDDDVDRLLADRGVRVVHFADWKKIDEAELARGKARGKPRDNFTTVEEMLAALD